MRSFRTEVEDSVVQRDIIELEKKIAAFKLGKIDEEKFRSLRLARGVYGQRQAGVQMIRIKIPFGKLNARKLRRICTVSDEYSTGRLHITTRQDLQIHHVSLDRTPELWAELEKDEVTLREACGNTVRNVTASETSGIDINEAFDPRPYAEALFKYFLRNPICQEMGRKIKISFSNTAQDSALAFMHDIGFVAKTKIVKGEEKHGFQIWIAGGLGSQPIHAQLYKDFMPVEEIIPFAEAVLRVFERYGERNRRMKARLKFLVRDLGFEEFISMVHEELATMNPRSPIFYTPSYTKLPLHYDDLITESKEKDAFRLWEKSNVFAQKDGLFAIGVKVRIGDFYTQQGRKLADLIENYAGNEITLTINQNLIIRHVEEKVLIHWFENLKELGLSDIGFNTFSDLTACPGTDTCNLGIASSTGLSQVLETVINEEYPEFASDSSINIKLSGCMNACGQHMISTIGFQGMSIKTKSKKVLPAAQVLLGGGVLGNGQGRFGNKVIKVPSKKAPDALRAILDDFTANRTEKQTFLSYYDKQGERYFYDLLKPLAQLENLKEDDFIDWGESANYIKAIGIGECAGVVIDLITTLFFDTEEKLELARRTLEEGNLRDSFYHSYAAIINTAKALLLADGHKTNSHASIINNFDTIFVDTKKIQLQKPFNAFALGYKQEEPSASLAREYYLEALEFYKLADSYRKADLEKVDQ